MAEMKRSLDSFSKEVLLAWIEVRGFSYFIEEFEGIEERLGGAAHSTCAGDQGDTLSRRAEVS
jgi:hypothetical protein